MYCHDSGQGPSVLRLGNTTHPYTLILYDGYRPDCPLTIDQTPPCPHIPGNVLDLEASSSQKQCLYRGAFSYGAIASTDLLNWDDVSPILSCWWYQQACTKCPLYLFFLHGHECNEIVATQVSNEISGLEGGGSPTNRHKHGTAVPLEKASLCSICVEADRTSSVELWRGSGILERCLEIC